ncbi:GlxA family transcriptional regulator [Brevibacterium spongiae]|uniref:Helix-turn-helix domain-containing protein n=1 Tax=Brevibacterium spongiae TaxID=2909672 RepID=A0ABY5SL77_9MICO|nr:helix-turn-helix domain-containing protein [Brevibacterium spongiae]UVI35227.1 helix-turn-helix domain-containing protein [Brevibacterium spongiae]
MAEIVIRDRAAFGGIAASMDREGQRNMSEKSAVKIAIFAFDGITMFHLSVPQMVFDEVARLGLADWETAVFSGDGSPVRTAEGYEISGIAGPQTASDADIVVIPSWHRDGRPAGAELRQLLVSEHARGTTVAGLCLGTFPIADAGLLTGRRVVTHWRAFELLAERHADLCVDESVLYIDDDDVFTSAGTASGLDACLHLVRARLGAAAANQVARNLVIAPHRDGGQAQYIQRPLPTRTEDDPIAKILAWALNRLGEDLSVERLAREAHMISRSFVRLFKSSTGTTPAAWVRYRRLDEARRLLESTDRSIDRIAADCGFGSATTFRQNFAEAFRTTPTDYRRQFAAKR